ncbi:MULTISPECIES: terminase TerL endonuclease subunit [unclassified Stenotrophomonas]|uniref:terminase large subunit n=1 Tax=unclassified Stenotrophomonas TaxID=196198 RepID=UPI00244A5375|nr:MULTISPECIES: terminase TerL endonuclease subunit [unclassified Stenotrophomonas]MBN5158835.1 terminase large subunit [Stenotrophomonas maltophilia]MDG9843763.1 terminase large subunit [Stenotrophomonas sp. GD04054]MDH0016621.1 terminase large subunit [Stenotrophomonas sp. GD04028]MDH0577553.1 terminase large subunit [Stenotrophomonas sp. GD03997]MDH0859438.1 terminase large subunit [Stenotrophomonas sp. GD03882]
MATRKSRATRSPRSESPAPPENDYVDVAIGYAKAAAADRGGRFGRLIKLAAKRFLDDLKRAKKKGSPFSFSRDHANHACSWIELLPHVEGKWETPEIRLHPSHVWFVVQLFGFRKPDGTRRFTSALFAVARKNAKSTLSAAILLYCECCEEEEGAQVISAATTGSQARIIFNVAKRMAEKKADLREAYGLECWANAISRVETGATFKPINAKASTQDGLNPSHVGLDEIHAHKTPDLLNVLQSAAGARRNPLWLFTTTEGYANPGPWSEIRQFATQLLEGVFGDAADHFLAIFFAVDKDDGDFDERAWHKANPLMDVNPHLLAAIRKESIEAKAMPSKLAEFQIKRLNRPAAAANGFLLLPKWNACHGVVDLDALKDVPCWGGLDLASTRDLASLRLVWRLGDKIITWGRRWVPESAVAQRTERGTVPYAGWVAAGLLEQTEGEVTDYAVIEQAVLDVHERFNLQSLAFDRWNATEMVSRLVAAEVPLVEFIQGTKSYHPAMVELERAYIGKRLVHDGDPVLAWCAANLVARKDVNLNMAPDKRRSADKIDDMTALLMAIGVSLTTSTEQSIDDFLNSPVIG